MVVRWNSTYMMLKAVIQDEVAFSGWINANYPGLITSETWHICKHLFKFLEVFYDATITLSGVYYPTSPLMMHTLVDIASHLKAYEQDNLLRPMVSRMKLKYCKYWEKIPMLYAFAFILDPRVKLELFASALAVITGALGIDYIAYSTDVRDKLSEIYAKYDQKYAGVRTQRPPLVPAAGKKKGAWSKLFGSSTSASSSCTSGPSPVLLGSGELSKYLNSDKESFNEDEEEEFDILQWWNEHKVTYPVLSILARDVLSVPVSSTSSESAFSVAGRILEDRRTSLTPEMVRTLMAVKDGELARRRAQHTSHDTELLSTFENLVIEAEDED
jgi:hypothetical protein